MLLTDTQASDPSAGVDGLLQRDEVLARLFPQRWPIDQPESIQRFAAEIQVFGRGQTRQQIQILMNHGDAGGNRLSWVGEANFGSVQLDRAARISLINAGHDLHQRGLAGAVLAHQRHHLA